MKNKLMNEIINEFPKWDNWISKFLYDVVPDEHLKQMSKELGITNEMIRKEIDEIDELVDHDVEEWEAMVVVMTENYTEKQMLEVMPVESLIYFKMFIPE